MSAPPPGPGAAAPRARRPRRATPQATAPPAAPAPPTKCHYVAAPPQPGPSGIKQCFRTVKSLRVVPLLGGAAPSSSSSSAPPSASAPNPNLNPSRAPPKRHDCRYCHKKFGSPGKLQQHVLSHTGELPFACPNCDKKFNSKFKLLRHVLIHNETRPHACPHCSRTFHRKDHLANHARVHSPVKYVYECDKGGCAKQYTSQLNYRKHMALHSAEEGDLDCKICSETFASKAEIVYHLKVHAGSRTVKNETDKKFTCDECDRKFFTAKDVRRHLVVHTRKRDFKCDYCPQTFGRKDHLVRHVKKAHSERITPSTVSVERRKGKGEAKRSKPETRLARRQQHDVASTSTAMFRFDPPEPEPPPEADVKSTAFVDVKDEPEVIKLETIPMMTLPSSSSDPTPSTSGLRKFSEPEPYSEMLYLMPSYLSESTYPIVMDDMSYEPRSGEGEIGDSGLVPVLETGGETLNIMEQQPVDSMMIDESNQDLIKMLQGPGLPTFSEVFQNAAQSPKPQHPPK